jgi:DnaK suppressor protein
MTTLELKRLEAALTIRADELRRSLAGRNRIAVQRSADVFDATQHAAEREFSARALEQESRLLRQVEAARDRLRNGAFGACLWCEEEIASKRLNAIPWAAYCVSCQEKAEGDAPFPRAAARAA